MTVLILLLLVLLALLAARLTEVQPQMPPAREGDAQPERPQIGDTPFVCQPPQTNLAERRALYLAWLLEQPTTQNRDGLWTEVGKLAAGADVLDDDVLLPALEFVNARKDPSDFTLTGMVRLYAMQAGTGRLRADQEQALRQAMLDFKYWFDQPNTTEVEMWTENHQILNHSSEYLAGQFFAGDTFSNTGWTGRQHQQAARERILRWIDLRARTGFAEWDSVVYYPEDLAPLLNLVDFAEDEEIRTRAAMMVDTLFFDIAVDSYCGHFATSHGRATSSSIRSAAGQSVTTLQAIAWGQGRFGTSSNMAVIALATSPRYQIPPVIEAVALDMPEEYTNLERHSIPLNAESAAQFGFRLDRREDLWVWWGMGAFTNPPVIDTTISAVDAWQLWHYPDFRDLKDLAKVLQRLGLLRVASRLLDPDPNGVLLSEVNKVFYRTPDYALSTAQDFRKGQKGYQQHIWQATLDPYAVVFVTNPDSLRADDSQRPSYWAGNGRQPRAAQVKNVLVALYNIPAHPSPKPLEARHYAFTHAYFPRWAFDEVVEVPANGGAVGGWIIGRKGSGYLALYSSNAYQWVTSGPDADQEIAAPGRQAVWLVQMGRAAVDGSFTQFVESIQQAEIVVDRLDVSYNAPGLGKIHFSWDDPLLLNGEEVPLRNYPRWQNPYTRVEFGQTRYEIALAGDRLVLDFAQGIREFTPPVEP